MKEIPQVSVFQFLRHSARILKNPLPFHKKNFEKHGDLFQLNLGFGNSVLFCRDSDLALLALQKQQKNFRKSAIQTKDLVKYVGKGLLTNEGEDWKTQRKLLQPTFYKKNIYSLLQIMKNTIEEELETLPVSQKFDIFPFFSTLAFKVVAKSLFGDAISDKEIETLQHITEEAQMMLVKELRQPYKKWWFSLTGELKDKIQLTNEARELILNIINERKKLPSQNKDLLDLLLQSTYEDGSVMTENQLLDEILILFIAGHETTSNALTFTAQLVAQHKNTQAQINEEIEATSSKKSNNLREIISSSTYLSAVLNESMRLYPPVYFIDRVNNKAFNYKDLTFKKDTTFLFSLYAMHRREDLWDQPLEFQPERFLQGENYSNQFFPFGAGPRKCIGNNFAMYEMLLVFHFLYKRFEVIPEFETIEITPLISLKPKNAFVSLRRK